MRLRKLLQENILKAEKENWELVLKEIQNELKENEYVKNNTTRQTKVKTLNRKIQLLKNKKDKSSSSHQSGTKLNNTKEKKNESLCCNRKANNQHSRIHFLNHFQSSLDSSKEIINKQKMVAITENIPFAISLAPPNQKNHAFSTEKLQKLSKEEIKDPNNRLYHFIAKERGVNLTIQKLPSISIHNERDENRINILYEELKEEEPNSGNLIRTKPPLTTSPNEYAFSDPYLDPHETSLSHKKELKIQQSEEPPSTKYCCFQNHEHSILNKDSLRSLIVEILNEMHLIPSVSYHSNVVPQKNVLVEVPGVKVSSIEKNTSMSYSNGKKSLLNESKHSIFSQTDLSCKSLNHSLKNAIKEVILENSTILPGSLHDQNIVEEHEVKVDKEIQTSLWNDMNPKLPHTSKETQVSLPQESDILSSNDTSEVVVSEQNLNEENLIPKENAPLESDITQQLALVTSRVENLISSFNNHVFKLKDPSDTEFFKNPLSDHIQSVLTREVSLQCSPYLISQSVNTSPIRVFEKASQCEDSKDEKQRNMFANNFTQTEDNNPDINIKVHVDVATQSQLVVADTSAQTEEIVSQVSEHSTNTSVSSTPVSENLFLDDVLSEGEIPWHLKLFSYNDKNANHSSSIAAESTSASEDKDFSLSEGEIPPRYIKHLHNLQTSTNPTKKGELATENKYSLNEMQNDSLRSTHLYASCFKISNQSQFEKDSSSHQSAGEIEEYVTNSFVFQQNYNMNQDDPPATSYRSLEQTSKLTGDLNFTHLCKQDKSPEQLSPISSKDFPMTKFPLKFFSPEKQLKLQSPSNWSSLSSIDISSSELDNKEVLCNQL